MIDYELEPKDYFTSNEEDALYTVNTSKNVLHKFGKVVLLLGIVVLSNTASANNYSFDLQESTSNDYSVTDLSSTALSLIPYEQYLNVGINRDCLSANIEKIKCYPNSWWDKFDADKPEEITFCNTGFFLNINTNDTLLEGAEILPKRNATLLIEWNTDKFMCSVNVGEADFSYSILNFKNKKSLFGQASIKDENEILVFFKQLESAYA